MDNRKIRLWWKPQKTDNATIYIDVENEKEGKKLLDVLTCYDKYIQDVNDGDCYVNGWYTVCIEEFYQNDYPLWIEEGLWQKLN